MFRRWGLFWAVILAFLIVSGALWYNSDADLRAEDKAMRAAGFPATWAEVPPFVAPPEVVRKAQRFVEVAERIGYFEPHANEQSWRWLSPGTRPSPSAAEWMKGISPSDMDALLTSVDDLPTGPFNIHECSGTNLRRRELKAFENIASFLSLRIALEDDTASQRDCGRLLKVAQWIQNRTVLQHDVSVHVQRAVADTLIAKNLDLKTHDTAVILRTLADNNEIILYQSLLEEYLWLRHVFTVFPSETVFNCPSARLIQIPQKLFGIHKPQWIDQVQCCALVRLGRGPLLRFFRNRLLIPIRTHPDGRSSLALAKGAGEGFIHEWWNLTGSLESVALPSVARYTDQSIRATLHLRLAAAHLAQEPWPEDPCQPPGHPLLPVIRNGITIGAYSVGPDGIDDGGDMFSDWCFALREQLGKPKASDALELPPAEAAKP